MPSFIWTLFIGGSVLGAFMAALWGVHLALRNAAIVDAGWAAGLPMLAVWYAMRGNGGLAPWILAGLVTIWGGRLAAHLLMHRVIGHEEEGRYRELRRRWRTHLSAKFLLFFEAQAVLNVVLSLPFFLVALGGGRVGIWQWTAVLIWVIAFIGEATADAQLAAFKRDASDRGARSIGGEAGVPLLCDVGLWRYSRHPNYFFEWLIWVAYATFALGVAHGVFAWISPALMLFFLFRVTGIPETEAQALRTRGDAYRQYQATTSAFIPWFPKRGSRA